MKIRTEILTKKDLSNKQEKYQIFTEQVQEMLIFKST